MIAEVDFTHLSNLPVWLKCVSALEWLRFHAKPFHPCALALVGARMYHFRQQSDLNLRVACSISVAALLEEYVVLALES